MGESRAEVEAETVERVARLVTTAGATLKEKKRPIKVVARDGTVKKVVPHVEVIEGLLHHEGISGELQAGVRPKTVLCAVCKCVVEVTKGVVPRTCKAHADKKLCPRDCGRIVNSRAASCRPCKTPQERSAAAVKASAKTPRELKSEWGREGGVVRQRSVTSEERMASIRRAQRAFEAASKEQRSEWARMGGKSAVAAMTPEERSERSSVMRSARTPESYRVAGKKAAGRRTKEQWSEASRKGRASMTPEARSAAMRKANAAQSAEQRSERQRKAWETRRAKKAAAEKAGEE